MSENQIGFSLSPSGFGDRPERSFLWPLLHFAGKSNRKVAAARAAIVVAPLAVSSGTNIKVLEGMACGKPIVSTPAGCAGLGLRDGHDVLVRQDGGDFARTICRLLSDEGLRRQLGDNARRTAEERFGWEPIAQRALESYLTLLDCGQMPARRRLRQRERQCTL